MAACILYKKCRVGSHTAYAKAYTVRYTSCCSHSKASANRHSLFHAWFSGVLLAMQQLMLDLSFISCILLNSHITGYLYLMNRFSHYINPAFAHLY